MNDTKTTNELNLRAAIGRLRQACDQLAELLDGSLPSPRARITRATACNACAEVCAVDSTTVALPNGAGGARAAGPSLARRLAWWLQRRDGQASTDIGTQWSRDHSTVLYGVRQVDDAIAAGDQEVIDRLRGAAQLLGRMDLVAHVVPAADDGGAE